MRELELKFVLDEATERTLRARMSAHTLDQGPPEHRDLRTIYYDAPGHRLRAQRMSLRLRHDGTRWVQTVKAGKRLNGGMSNAAEFEAEVRDGTIDLRAVPHKATRKTLKAIVKKAALSPVCETRMHRTAFELRPDNRTRVELAIDVGEIRAGDRVKPFREAEIELLEGSPRVLFKVARELFPQGGLHLSRLSKAARGSMLARDGRIDPPLQPRRSAQVDLKPDQTVEAAAQAILRECADQVTTNIGVCAALDDAEGPHQLRVGLRRLRIATFIIGQVARGKDGAELAAEARWLGGQVASLRDLQVLRDEMLRDCAARYSEEPGFATLSDALDASIAAEWAALRATLQGDRLQAMIFDLTCFTELRGWLAPEDSEQTERLAEPFSRFAARILDARWRSFLENAKGMATFDAEQRHVFRKSLKKLRYTADFMAPAFPVKKTRAFANRLSRLQDDLGASSDAHAVRLLLTGPDAPGASDAAVQRAVGLLLGKSDAAAETAWADVLPAWRKLADQTPFWQ